MAQLPEKFDTDQINASVDIVELVSRYTTLKKDGKDFKALCLFHAEKSPSMTVVPDKGFVHCFGCGAHHDAISFFMAVESLDFKTACGKLLNGSGTTGTQPIPQRSAKLKKAPPRITTTPPADSKPDMRIGKLGEPTATWAYHTPEGEILGYVARYHDQEAGKKTIRCWSYGSRSEAQPKTWECGHFSVPRPLYNLHKLTEHPDKQVLIVEGEKTADAAQALFPGMVVVSWPGGCEGVDRVDWSYFKGRKAVLLGDNDAAGTKAMQRIAKLLHKEGAIEIKGIRSETDIAGIKAPDGWDVADAPDETTPAQALQWARENVFTYPQTLDDMVQEAANAVTEPPNHEEIPLNAYGGDSATEWHEDAMDATATQPAPVTARLVGIYDRQQPTTPHTAASLGVISYRGSEKQPKARDWLWRDKIACGVITGLSGDPGLGKSQITASLAAIVTVGGQWPVTRDRAPQGSVIILNCEDDFETTIAPRLIAAGADMDKIHVFQGVQTVGNNGILSERMFDLSQDINRLVVMMEEIGDVRLVIIDPISAYVGNGKVDSHNNTDVRSVLAPLTKAAEANHVTGKQGAAILIVNHLNKDGSKSALHRTQGSVAWTAAPRCIWAVIRDREDESGRSRLMMCVKNNIGPDTDGFRYEVEGFHLTDSDPLIETSRIMWHTDAVDSNADQAFQSHTDAEDKASTNEAIEFLRDLLKFGPVSVFEIETAARKNGQLLHNLRRAKTRLKVKSSKQSGFGGKWVWELPTTD